MLQNKKSIIIIVLCVICAGIVGFYGGRYYEQSTMRNRFKNMRQRNGVQGESNPTFQRFEGRPMDR